MRLLFSTSEAFPLIKTGGLADVSGALPIALQALGVDVRIILPAYRGVMAQCPTPYYLGTLTVFGDIACQIFLSRLPGSDLPIYLIDQPSLYDREGGPYHHPTSGDWEDNPLRFAVLAKITSLLATSNPLTDWHADVVHCNDWQTGLTPYFLRQAGSAAKCLFSIHNMAFQGNFHPDWRFRLGLAEHDFQPAGYEFFGHVSFMKAGRYCARGIATVSPTYAREIQTEAFGFGFQGLLQHRNGQLSGILNGIDTQAWDPSNDPYLPASYSAQHLHGKARVKQALQQEVGLQVSPQAPLLGVVSRLTYQKGLDLLPEIVPSLLAGGAQLVVLGSGDHDLQQAFRELALQFPGRIAVRIGYDEGLSHRIMAGADLFVMPSRFEPCGLNQMYGLRYGTPPVVANTGGLADSVQGGQLSASGVPADMTGFVIPETTAASLLVTLRLAMDLYDNSGHWQQLQQQAMQQDVSWETSAKRYFALYQAL